MKVHAADIGGTSIRAALVTDTGDIVDRAEAPTPPDPAEGYACVRDLWAGMGKADGG